MPTIQAERYQAAASIPQEKVRKQQPQQKNRILQVLHQLRDISDHPLLCDSQWEQFPTSELIDQSGKLIVTVSTA